MRLYFLIEGPYGRKSSIVFVDGEVFYEGMLFYSDHSFEPKDVFDMMNSVKESLAPTLSKFLEFLSRFIEEGELFA